MKDFNTKRNNDVRGFVSKEFDHGKRPKSKKGGKPKRPGKNKRKGKK